jgi:porin
MKNKKQALLYFVSLCMVVFPVFAQDTLTGDWGGARSEWSASGVDLELVYTADYFEVVSGGVRSDGEYLGNVDIVAAIDGEKLFGQKGATYLLYVLGNHGHDHGGGPGQHAGDFQGLSNIDATDTWKIYEAWYEQAFADDQASVRFGLYDLNSEFDAIETAGLFINSSFGIGPDYSQSGQNGPSIFPTTSVALRLAYQLTDNYYLQAAVFDGVPGDPDDNKGTHIKFSSGDGLLYAAEFGYAQGGEDDMMTPYGKWALGVWRYSESFDDLVDTDGGGDPVKRKNNQGIYLLGEYTAYREKLDPQQGLAIFARYGIANDDINQIDSYLGLGLAYTGLFPGRDEDQLGLGIAVASNGDKYKQIQQDNGSPVEGSETTIELSYRAQVLPWLAIQPDIQWIKNPGMDPALKDATVVGVRTEIVF